MEKKNESGYRSMDDGVVAEEHHHHVVLITTNILATEQQQHQQIYSEAICGPLNGKRAAWAITIKNELK